MPAFVWRPSPHPRRPNMSSALAWWIKNNTISDNMSLCGQDYTQWAFIVFMPVFSRRTDHIFQSACWLTCASWEHDKAVATHPLLRRVIPAQRLAVSPMAADFALAGW